MVSAHVTAASVDSDDSSSEQSADDEDGQLPRVLSSRLRSGNSSNSNSDATTIPTSLHVRANSLEKSNSSALLFPSSLKSSRSSSPESSRNKCPSCHRRISGAAAINFSSDSDIEDSEAQSATSAMSAVPCAEGEAVIVVGGKRFKVVVETLLKYPDTMLARMFGSGINKSNAKGEYVLGEYMSSPTFRTILQYYESGLVNR